MQVQDITTLLGTHDRQYAAACALDFSNPPKFYDTIALRDGEGREPLMQTWPYFRSRVSRSAVRQGVPVPVRSCWNGAGMELLPLIRLRPLRKELQRLAGPHRKSMYMSNTLSSVAMDATPFYDTFEPLRFRAIPDSLAKFHLEGSECCLIHADNPLSPSKGIWPNPSVRVGYNGPAYDVVHNECGGVSPYSVFTGLWTNRLRHWLTPTWTQSHIVARRPRAWAANDPDLNLEQGTFCLINEMQVLDTRGWLHV